MNFKHWDWVDIAQYGLGGLIAGGTTMFMVDLPDDPNMVHLFIIALGFLVAGTLFKLPGFRSILSRLIERFAPKTQEEDESA